MRFDNRTGNGKPQTGSTGFSMRDKRLGQSWEYLSRNTDAGIENTKHDLTLNEIAGDGENSTFHHGVARILNHTREQANETRAVELDVAVVTNVFNEMDITARK